VRVAADKAVEFWVYWELGCHGVLTLSMKVRRVLGDVLVFL
jgi:hypothetical protein